MRQIFKLNIERATPSVSAILAGQGISDKITVSQQVMKLAEQALAIYGEIARPVGILAEISRSDFADIFEGYGENEPDSPLDTIYRSSDHLALFAVTIGAGISHEIEGLFSHNEFPLGAMLDSAASEGTELTSIALEEQYRRYLGSIEHLKPSTGLLRFSPGYCGWHISAQKYLFNFLHPEEIGLRLRNTFLMEPLKSISGVIIAGPKEIFDFDDNFSFCLDCMTHTCRDRIKALGNSHNHE